MLLQITSAYNAISASGAQLKSLPQYVAKTQGRRKVEGGGVIQCNPLHGPGPTAVHCKDWVTMDVQWGNIS